MSNKLNEELSKYGYDNLGEIGVLFEKRFPFLKEYRKVRKGDNINYYKHDTFKNIDIYWEGKVLTYDMISIQSHFQITYSEYKKNKEFRIKLHNFTLPYIDESDSMADEKTEVYYGFIKESGTSFDYEYNVVLEPDVEISNEELDKLFNGLNKSIFMFDNFLKDKFGIDFF